jgi:predicted DNA-binding transcriptional regulator AlpA
MTAQSHKEKPQPTVEWDKLPLMLDETKAAAVLGMSVSFLRKSRCEGCKKVTLETANDEESAPPFVKIGGRVKYPTSDLREWAAGLTRRRVI